MIGTGTWRARAMEATLREVGEKKTACVTVRLRATEGTFEGETIYWDGFLTDKTIDRTVESLRHLGWQGDDLSDLSTVRGEAEIVVEEEERNDKVYHRVKWVNGIGGGQRNALEQGDAKTLADRLRARVQAADQARADAAAGKTGTPF